MYKDVWKRILAVMVTVCMVVGMMPDTVMAAEAKNYHTYQHGSGSTSGWVEADTVAAVFTVGQNSSGGAEILDSVSFNAYVNEEGKDASATVAYYVNPKQGEPDSGTWVGSTTIRALQDGLNSVEIGMDSQNLKAGDTFAVVISLEGAGVAYYGGASAGQTYLKTDDTWTDAGADGKCMAIRAYTYNVGDDGEDTRPWLNQLISTFTSKANDNDVAVAAITPAQLNKTNMNVTVNGYGDIALNDAEGSVTWSVDDSSVATIEKTWDNTARVNGLTTGDTTIRAQYNGTTYTCTLKVSSSITDADIRLSLDGVEAGSVVYNGDRHFPLISVAIGSTKLIAGTDYQINYKMVDAQGAESNIDNIYDSAMFVNAGTYRFEIVGQHDYSGVKTVDFVITPKQITDDSITVASQDSTSWNPANPTSFVTGVTDTALGKALTPGAVDDTVGDYYLAEAVNEAGEAGINIIGRGNYEGTRFCATPKSVVNAQITFAQSEYVYLGAGKACQPVISVAVGGYVLSPSEYDVIYENCDKAGTGKVTISGKNGYYGSTSATFKILPKDVSNVDQNLIQSQVEAVVSNAVGSAQPEIVVTYNGTTLTAGTDYNVSFPSTGVCVITGIGNFTGSRTETYAVASGDIADYAKGFIFTESTSNTLTTSYTGAALTPAVVLVDASGTKLEGLKEGEHYTVIYTNNVNKGTAYVTVKGIGAWGGTLNGSFTIEEADLSNFEYQFKNASGSAVSTSNFKINYSLNADDMKPEVIVKNKQGTILKEGTDYKLTYSVDTIGTAGDVCTNGLTVTVAPADGNSNYKNSKVLSYGIQRCSLKDAVNNGDISVTLSKEAFSYTGKPQVPTVTVAYTSGAKQTLVEGRDYSVTPTASNAPSEAGDYEVVITGMGNYMGNVQKKYKITCIDVQTIENITAVGNETGYTGNWFAMKWFDKDSEENNKLKLNIVDNAGNVLEEGTASNPKDYTLSYENIDAVSTKTKYAKVTITGHGAYAGTRVIYYLLAGNLEDYSVAVKDEGLIYTGEELTLQKGSVTVSTGMLLWKDVLEQGTDYKLVYSDNVDAGIAKLVVEPVSDAELPTANGCYRYAEGIAEADKLNGTFKIGQKDISSPDDASIALTNAIVKPYEGTDVTLTESEIPLTYNGKPVDFTIVPGSYAYNDSPSKEASVLIEGKGNYKGNREINFVITGKSLDGAEATIATQVYTGDKLEPEITALKIGDKELKRDKDYEYGTSDYKDNVDAGTATITIHGLGEYLGSETTVEFTIEPRDINDTLLGTCTVEGVADAGYTYTSQAIEPTVVVKYLVKGANTNTRKTLVERTDYEVSYRDNVKNTVDTGVEAAVVITGTGNYTGSYEKTFAIAKKNISDTDVTVAEIASQPYNGGVAVTPIPDISYKYGTAEGDVYRLESSDYTLAYSGQNKIGTAQITITGKGNFEGTKTVKYHIGDMITDADKFAISCPDVEQGKTFVYDGSYHKPTVVVTNLTTGAALEVDESGNKDYKVTYKNNQNAGTATIVVEGTGTYAGTTEINFTIVQKNLADRDVELAIEDVTDGSYQAGYTGSPVEPKVTLAYNGTKVDASEYTVTYSGTHTDAGYVNVTVTAGANGNFTGSKTIQNTSTAKYEIVPASIGGGSNLTAGFTMDVVEDQPLGANGATPTPKLYYNGTALVAGKDYTYSYENNTAIGTEAVVILTGIENYTGSVRQKFAIRGSIEGAEVKITKEIWYKDYVKTDNVTGEPILPSAIELEDDEIIVTVNGAELVKDTDYEISYTNNTWVGTATITIKGKGNYAGLVTQKMPIKADLSETTVTVSDQKYTGSAIKAVPVVEYYGKALTEGTHFMIHTYTNNTSISDKGATVMIIGNEINGFYGQVTASFSITADADALTVSGAADSYMYRGKAIEPSVVVKLGSATLKASDYDVTYGTNTNVGYGTIVVKGTGTYEGLNGSAIFEITPQDVNSLTVMDGTSNTFADREYMGLPILPEVSLRTKIGITAYTLPASDYKVSVAAGSDNVSVGTVKLVIEGIANANGSQNITGSREVSFKIVPKSLSKPTSGVDKISVQAVQDTYAYDGTAKEPEMIVTYQYGDSDTEVRTLNKGTDYIVSYSDNIAAGTAKAIVTGIGNYNGSRTANFTITAQDIAVADVTLPNGTTYSYMGSTVGVEPEVLVTVKGTPLTRDKDYTVSYENNKVCGTATVTITGIGDFSGKTATTFTIESHSIKESDVVVEAIPNQAYTGSPIVPELTITCGDYKLVKGVDYKLTCTGNTEIGQASVTISGINGFRDSRTELFRIASSIEKAEVTGLKDSYVYTGQPLTVEQLGITEVRIGTTVLGADDYAVTFAKGSDGMSVGRQTVVLTGTGNYGGSKEFEITIAAKNIADADVVMSGFAESLPYEHRLEQNVTLTWGAITLQKGTDYEVTCAPGQSADTCVMTVTGLGNYTGTIQKNYAVEQAAVDSLEIRDVSSDYTYTGQAIEPKPRVFLGDTELKEGTDYTLTYSDNVNVGVAAMCITGMGTCFDGEKEVTFTILRRSINHGTVSQIATQVYTGRDVYPAVLVTDNGTALAEDTDYTLMYKNNRRAGTATVVVAGKGNYTSTKTVPFAIRPCNAVNVTVTGTSATTASLNWSGEGVVTGYEIYRMTAGGKWQLVGGTKATNYMDAKLSSGTSYTYKVRSYVVEDGETYYGEFSDVISATTSK